VALQNYCYNFAALLFYLILPAVKCTLLACLLACSFPLGAQPLWTDVAESSIPPDGERRIVPAFYRTVRLDRTALLTVLDAAPERFTLAALSDTTVLVLPLPDGRTSRFRLTASPVLAPELQSQYPEIRTFTAAGLDDPTALLKCDLTPWGFHAAIWSARLGTVFIDPYRHGNADYYTVYYKRDFPRPSGKNFFCETENKEEEAPVPAGADDQGDCLLRQYQLALACTGEYATFHGGTTATALAAMATSMNRVNGVFEKDAAVTMIMVANNNLLVFLNGSTDPYTNNNGGTMLGQNITTCNNIIGSANYDIGHVFSTGGGGVAYLSCVCGSSKAGGVTGGGSPVGDPFDIDYVAHEMGHQFGGAHTQNNDCNRSSASAMEPGSASTIMGYAGICDPNVQSNSDDYFHARSLEQMGGFVLGGGNGCATVINTGNNAPAVEAGANYTVPKSTPYVLTATGSDPNGNMLTYCWEQMNPQVGVMPPQPANTQGPMFRSLDPVESPARYFPDYQAVLNNESPTWEVLSSVGRPLAFRVTARDNFAGAGCTEEDDLTITVSGTAGPFRVTSPNGGEVWNANTTQTVTWDVAGSNASPVSCANVRILLSTDGGSTWPTVLAASVPNNGSAVVTVPNAVTASARIMVQSIGNVFYDLGNAEFSVVAPLPVELIDFRAEVREPNDVWLHWRTATERDNSGFEVEMRSEAQPDFSRIGWVRGQGTSNVINTYSFVAPGLAPGTYYFRLKQTDSDGTYTWSPMRAAEVSGGIRVTCFPNPARGSLKVRIEGGSCAEADVQLADSRGQVVFAGTMPTSPGGTELSVPADGLPPGLYHLAVRCGNGEVRTKVMVE
jgi:hypothetical protein